MIETVHIPRISIDFETAATCDSAAILTFGACSILPEGGIRKMFYMRASLASNEANGRTVDTATMKFWDEQDPIIRREAFGGTDDIHHVLDEFKKWAYSEVSTDLSKIELWSRGADFDCKILQHAYMHIDGSYPFNFRNHMCQRTFAKMMPSGLVGLLEANTQKHLAISDAIYQARVIEMGLRCIEWTAPAMGG